MPELRVPITSSVLRWAVAESGMTVENLGESVGVPPTTLRKWMDGSEQPSLSQFKDLARVLRRPTATFLLPRPPQEESTALAFRHRPGEPDRVLRPEERLRIREVVRLQKVVGWILDELGERPRVLASARVSEKPETVGKKIRDLLGVSVEQQHHWGSEREAFRTWRSALEQVGVLVFSFSMGEEAARGFSVFDDHAPAVAINTHWNQSARTFTMIHEFAHLITRTSSACGDGGSSYSASAPDDSLERWCEQAAAACLMPAAAVVQALNSIGSGRTLATVDKIARVFRVSLQAAALRLIDLGEAQWNVYRAIPAGSDSKPRSTSGGGRPRAKVRLDQYGRLTNSIVLRGLDRELISRTDAMGFLDVSYKNLDELASMI